MKNIFWKIALLSAGLILLLAGLDFLAQWGIHPSHIGVAVVIVALVFLIRLVSPTLERMGNVPFFAGVLVVFLASRLAWLLIIPTLPTSDFQIYFQTACDIATGKGVASDMWLFQNGWGYQFFLSFIFRILGCSLLVGKAMNLILGLATIPVLYHLAARFGGKAVGRWAVLLFVFWPVQLMFTSVLGTEHLALLLALLGFLFGVRLLDSEGNLWFNAVLCSLFLTLGTIVRPATLLFLGAVGLALLFQKKPLKLRLFSALALAATFLLLNGAYIMGLKTFNNGITPNPSFSLAESLLYGTNYEARGSWSQEDSNTINTWPKDNALKLSIRAIRQRLKTYKVRQIVSLLHWKNYEFWGAPAYGSFWSTYKLDRPSGISWLKSNESKLKLLSFLYQFFLIAGTFVTAIGLFCRRGTAKEAALLVTFISTTAMYLVLVATSRYSHSFMPLLFILAGMGFASVWKIKDANENADQERKADTTSLAKE